jgi:hypothetical protein
VVCVDEDVLCGERPTLLGDVARALAVLHVDRRGLMLLLGGCPVSC